MQGQFTLTAVKTAHRLLLVQEHHYAHYTDVITQYCTPAALETAVFFCIYIGNLANHLVMCVHTLTWLEHVLYSSMLALSTACLMQQVHRPRGLQGCEDCGHQI